MAVAHLGGLLHLMPLAFVMTLAYLGLDKVGDGSRDKLVRSLEEKSQRIAEILKREEFVSEIDPRTVDSKTRAAIYMLCCLGNLKCLLYSGLIGWIVRAWYSLHLFVSFQCFLRRTDLIVVRIVALISGVIFFGLVYAETFSVQIDDGYLAAFFYFGVIVIVMVVLAARHLLAAERRLEKTFNKSESLYHDWSDAIRTMKIGRAAVAVAKPITRPDE